MPTPDAAQSNSGPEPNPGPEAPELYEVLERELRRIAAGLLRSERVNHTLQPTALMHEAWLRLANVHQPWRDAGHFAQAAAGTMRRVLVDHARSRARDKRAGGERVTLSAELLAPGGPPEDLLTVDEILAQLEGVDPELARIVELRVFGGLDHPAIARLLDRSLRTVERGWRLARAFLAKTLRPE